ncbi:MAG TPA: hypothetical protein VIG24_12990 [Acidimicrobiia bacterium]
MTDPQDLVLEVRRKAHLPFISVPKWWETSPQLAEVHAKWFDDNPTATVRVIARGRGRVVYPKRKKQQFLVAYGGGTIKQAQIAGEYPPPDVLGDVSPTGRYRRPPEMQWPQAYATGPRKLSADDVATLAAITPEQARATMQTIMGADFSELERRIAAWHADLVAQGYRPAGDGPLSDTYLKEDPDA